MRTGQNTNVRTSILNLIICAPDIESAQRASALLRHLSSTHLSRVTILVLDSRSDAPGGITTWVTLRCFSVISDIMRHCFEQTTILVSGSAIRSTANIVQPLLKAQLPVYLWWIGDAPFETALFPTSSTQGIVARMTRTQLSLAHPGSRSLQLRPRFSPRFARCQRLQHGPWFH